MHSSKHEPSPLDPGTMIFLTGKRARVGYLYRCGCVEFTTGVLITSEHEGVESVEVWGFRGKLNARAAESFHAFYEALFVAATSPN